ARVVRGGRVPTDRPAPEHRQRVGGEPDRLGQLNAREVVGEPMSGVVTLAFERSSRGPHDAPGDAPWGIAPGADGGPGHHDPRLRWRRPATASPIVPGEGWSE